MFKKKLFFEGKNPLLDLELIQIYIKGINKEGDVYAIAKSLISKKISNQKNKTLSNNGKRKILFFKESTISSLIMEKDNFPDNIFPNFNNEDIKIYNIRKNNTKFSIK